MVKDSGDHLWVRLAATAEPRSARNGTHGGAQAGTQDDAGGKDSATVLRVVLMDVTARRQAEVANEALISASLDAIISVNEDERIVVFSPAAEKMFQLSAAEAIGQTIHRFIPARFREVHDAHVRQFRQNGVTARTDRQFTRVSALRSDGSEFPVEASISHAVIDGKHFFR
ncbi:MAG: PAS domain S-box protein [Betaproteobacteria bacterium]|nr:PAS domain S-box protein [Betaproteobacteria bacterium]